MHISFEKYFVDPETREPLSLEITKADGDFVIEGFLCGSSKRYPIVRGIPRFVDFQEQNYSGNFGYQWQRWPTIQFESENKGRPMAGYTRNMWELITGVVEYEIDVRDKVILDMGCGSGRFLDIAREKGAKVIGIDYSSAVEAARKQFGNDPQVCICQADALKLPILSGSVDGCYSIGVLHHTPDPEEGVRQALKALRPGGWFALSVYAKGEYYDKKIVHMWRRLFGALRPLFSYYPPLLYAYVAAYVLRPVRLYLPLIGKIIQQFVPFVCLPDVRWSLLDTFDSITPSYQSAHESYEIYTWFKRAGFINIAPVNWGFSSYRGQNPD